MSLLSIYSEMPLNCDQCPWFTVKNSQAALRMHRARVHPPAIVENVSSVVEVNSEEFRHPAPIVADHAENESVSSHSSAPYISRTHVLNCDVRGCSWSAKKKNGQAALRLHKNRVHTAVLENESLSAVDVDATSVSTVSSRRSSRIAGRG